VLSQLTKSTLPHIGREGSPSPLSVDYLQLLLPSSHVAMLSHPAEVAKVIEEAAANGRRP